MSYCYLSEKIADDVTPHGHYRLLKINQTPAYWRVERRPINAKNGKPWQAWRTVSRHDNAAAALVNYNRARHA